jgi:hypothetical protein
MFIEIDLKLIKGVSKNKEFWVVEANCFLLSLKIKGKQWLIELLDGWYYLLNFLKVSNQIWVQY